MSTSDVPSPAREIESILRRVHTLLYDTSVPPERLDAEVLPHLAAGVTFKDPWQTGAGREAFRLGMKGFHAMFRFRFELRQLSIELDERGRGGRAIADGVMQLEQFRPLFTYPLRTLVVYDFVLPRGAGEPSALLITAQEEMWSIGDMIRALPLVGRVYGDVFRPAFGRAFLLASRAACALRRWK